MPLITIFIFVASRSRLKKSHVIADDWVFLSPLRSRPEYMGRVPTLAARLLLSWQPAHSRVSVRRRRNSVSWLPPRGGPTVTATARQPAFSARCTIALATSHLLVA